MARLHLLVGVLYPYPCDSECLPTHLLPPLLDYVSTKVLLPFVRVVLAIFGSAYFNRSRILILNIVFRGDIANVVPFANLQTVCAADMVPGKWGDKLKQGLASKRINSLCMSKAKPY